MEQLEGSGWTPLYLETDSPSEASFRTSFREVLIEPELRLALKKINPWLEDNQIDEAIGELVRLKSSNLIEANMEATDLLLNNTVVSYVDLSDTMDSFCVVINISM